MARAFLPCVAALCVALLAVAPFPGCSAANCNDLINSGPVGALVGGTARDILTIDFAGSRSSGLCPRTTPPATEEQALAPGSPCAPTAEDTPCQACARASCCSAVVLACDGSCTCNLACHTLSCSPSDRAKCGPTDDTYDAAIGCLSDHCAEACP